MNLKIGIVGLPNVGKSTLFNALTNAHALAANYPFATIEPNVGIVPVPDNRLDVLAKMYETEKVIPATVEFVDIAGLVEGASKGEGLGNKFLAHIRECQIICHVVRVFKNDDILHVSKDSNTAAEVDPKQDIEIIQTELELADLETREKVEAKRKKNKEQEEKIPYLTEKPVIYMFNVDENELVCFYTDTKHRVFPRSKNVIGRDVKNCHPKASVHIVEEIIKKFRSGEQDKAEFWINKPDLFIYIVYYAVRDENGKFRGVLEMMQDCTHIRSLQGSQTLLTWEQQEKGEDTETSEGEGNKENIGTLEAEGNRENTGTLKAGKLTEITEDTLLKDILEADPNVKTLLFRLSDRFKALNTPLARIMMPKATVKIMSERAEVDLDTLLRELREYFKL